MLATSMTVFTACIILMIDKQALLTHDVLKLLTSYTFDDGDGIAAWFEQQDG